MMRVEELEPGNLYITGLRDNTKHILCYLRKVGRDDYYFYRLKPEFINDKQIRIFSLYTIERGTMKLYKEKQ